MERSGDRTASKTTSKLLEGVMWDIPEANAPAGARRSPPPPRANAIRGSARNPSFADDLPVIRRRAHFSRQSESRIAITEFKLPHRLRIEVSNNERTDIYGGPAIAPPRPDVLGRLQRAMPARGRRSRAGQCRPPLQGPTAGRIKSEAFRDCLRAEVGHS